MYIDIISFFFVNYIEGAFFYTENHNNTINFAIGFVEHEILKKKLGFK